MFQDECALQLAMEDIKKGFNHTIMCMGEVGAGKSTRLFGMFAWPASSQPGPCCLLTAVLRNLLDLCDSHVGVFQLGLSFWEIVNDEVCPLVPCPTMHAWARLIESSHSTRHKRHMPHHGRDAQRNVAVEVARHTHIYIMLSSAQSPEWTRQLHNLQRG